ncbi:MFS transporter [Kineococcus rhizosphaerae]|uniref:MFS transporter n=1 Tax=Kineococcus rhizosphaerae TaxID=559628 RepID=A0A2T0RB39_9ACTN|nr:MFS transporter [Kineococcus rhizosphaerae]PRY18367.1 hypothetical protein CLV37_101612 [Kineococcus rhizosphaerae]
MLTAFFAAAAWGRVGLAMTPLALLWSVHERTGSWAQAGLAGAGLALAEGLAGPQTARLVDRSGQTRVLPPLAAAHVVAVVAGTVVEVPPFAWGVAVGATLPQLGAFSAARWSHRLGPATGLSRAFGWEAVVNSTAFLLGPVLVSALAAAGHPAAGVPTALALVGSGTLVLAALRGSAPPPAPTAGRARRSPPRGIRVPLLVNAWLGVHFGALPVAVAAGAAAAAPTLFAVSSAGGLVAGLVMTRRPGVALHRAAWVLGGAGALLALPWPTPALGAVLFAVGAAVPPVVVAAAVRTRRDAAAHRLTSAFAWLASASAAGSAAGSALAGQGAERLGPAAVFALAAAALAAVPLTVLVCGRITRCERCARPDC